MGLDLLILVRIGLDGLISVWIELCICALVLIIIENVLTVNACM